MVVDVIPGNMAIAHGVRLSRVQVIPVYPITPQTTIAEYLAEFVANGELDAEFIEIEGEHSGMAACYGASLAGARTFTATCSHGLAYMHEPITQVTAYRLPIVMAVTNRKLGGLHTGQPDYTDTMPERDTGWMQFYLESNQEALDTIIQTYRIAEDVRITLPAMVCIDGFYLSFSYEPVEIPDQEDVDAFLPPFEAKHIIMDPTERFESPLLTAPSEVIPTYERLYDDAFEKAKRLIEEVDREFDEQFGRSYGGLVERYKCEDAEAVLVTIGSMTTAARRAVDKLRGTGEKIGLIKLRSYRPFPNEILRKVACEVEAMAVVDRSTSRGVGSRGGPVFIDTKAAIYDVDERPVALNFIAGLFGRDIRIEDFEYMAKKTLRAVREGKLDGAIDYMENLEAVKKYSPPPEPQIPMPDSAYCPGLRGCIGCGLTLAMRHIFDVLGKNSVMAVPSSCAGANVLGAPFTSPLGVPHVISNLAAAGGVITGLKRALRIREKHYVNVFGLCGDGGTVDLGLQSLSGAAERGEPVIWICYDNEGYMNTGIQRSGSTPVGAWTTTTPIGPKSRGKKAPRKNVPLLMALHGIPFVATASLAYIHDFKRKLRKASEVTLRGDGLAYIHVQQPCPTGWLFPSEKTIEIAKLAVLTGVWPVYEVENGELKVNIRLKQLRPIEEYLRLQRRFRHLTEEEVTQVQETVSRQWEELIRLEKAGLPKVF